MGADKNLYNLVFGESVLNAAVAIVMYQPMLSFHSRPIDMHGVLYAISYFLVRILGCDIIKTSILLTRVCLPFALAIADDIRGLMGNRYRDSST